MTKQSPTERLEAETWARTENRQLKVQVEAQSAEIKELKRLVTFYDSARTEPIQLPAWRRPERQPEEHVGTLIAQLTDWHLDEVVKPEEILHLNAFNREIAMQRVARWIDKVITLPRAYMQGIKLEGLVVPSTGDLFTGEIHKELRETNEDKVLASFLYWLGPIIEMVETFDNEFPAVEWDCVVGNHTRLGEKYDYKGRVKDNLEWLFWSIVRDRIADRGKTKHTTINVSESANMNINIYGRNYLLDHGYEFKGGSGISGAFSPLSLGAHRKNLRQAVADMPMHTMVIGHMHQIINIPGVIMGGTLKGFDEYAFNLNLRPDENGAGQAMWVTSPQRAQVLWMPIYVTDRKAEGW